MIHFTVLAGTVSVRTFAVHGVVPRNHKPMYIQCRCLLNRERLSHDQHYAAFPYNSCTVRPHIDTFKMCRISIILTYFYCSCYCCRCYYDYMTITMATTISITIAIAITITIATASAITSTIILVYY